MALFPYGFVYKHISICSLPVCHQTIENNARNAGNNECSTPETVDVSVCLSVYLSLPPTLSVSLSFCNISIWSSQCGWSKSVHKKLSACSMEMSASCATAAGLKDFLPLPPALPVCWPAPALAAVCLKAKNGRANINDNAWHIFRSSRKIPIK